MRRPIDVATVDRAINTALAMFALRDEFAKAAMQGCLSGTLAVGRSLAIGDEKSFAESSYIFADALLKARTK